VIVFAAPGIGYFFPVDQEHADSPESLLLVDYPFDAHPWLVRALDAMPATRRRYINGGFEGHRGSLPFAGCASSFLLPDTGIPAPAGLHAYLLNLLAHEERHSYGRRVQ